MVKQKPQAFFTTDVLIGLFIISALAAALAVAVGRQRKATTSLGDTRQAVYLAEHVLLDLELGRETPRDTDDSTILIGKLDGDAPEGQQWLEVTATVRGRCVTLIGVAARREGR